MKIEVSAGLVSLEAQRTPISLLLPAPRCHLHPSACGAPSHPLVLSLCLLSLALILLPPSYRTHKVLNYIQGPGLQIIHNELFSSRSLT